MPHLSPTGVTPRFIKLVVTALWIGSAATVAHSQVAFLSADFNEFGGPGAPWTIIDPLGNASVSIVGAGTGDARLAIDVASGQEADAWNDNRAPRVMQPSTDGDFVLELKIDTLPTERYQMAGVLVEQDAQNWLRFDYYSDGERLWSFAGGTLAGQSAMAGKTQVAASLPLYIRVQRSGDSWTHAFSTDGQVWAVNASFVHALNVTAVGPFAGNAGPSPAFHAEFDYLFEASAPIVPEDGNPIGEGNTLASSWVGAGLVALYEFEAASSTTVFDTSGVGDPLDLEIANSDAVTWQPGHLVLNSESEIASPGPATKIIDACRSTGEITLEAWVSPAVAEQSGPARIVTLSNGSLLRNATLGHGGSGLEPETAYGVRLRTTATSENGMPALITGADTIPDTLHHVVYTCSNNGLAKIYVNGVVVVTDGIAGDLSTWDGSYRLSLGNEIGASRPWFGALHRVAIYDRALTEAEVSQNYAAGTGDTPAGSLDIDPVTDLVAFGVTGESGGYDDAAMTYALTNPGNEPVTWDFSSSEAWAYADGPSAGILASGAQALMTVRLDGDVIAGLRAGNHTASLWWVNTTNGFGSVELHARLFLSDFGDEKPGPHNTGPSAPELLVPSGSITATVDGQLIENVDISGVLVIQANDVTIRNFRINGQGNSYGVHTGFGAYSGTVLEYGEILNIDSAGIFGKNFTARRLNIHESGGDGIKARGNVLVEESWIHHLGMNVGSHADGNQTRGGSHFTFRGNNIDMPIDTAGYRANAAFIIQDEVGVVDDFLIEGNWLNGGNYTVMLDDGNFGGSTNIRIINNRFGRDFRYGPIVFDVPAIASGNVWEDTGELLDENNQ